MTPEKKAGLPLINLPPTAESPQSRWVLTDAQGIILDASVAAAGFLGGSRRGLVGRSLYLFFQNDRMAIARQVATVASLRAPRMFVGRVRPKERKPVDVSVEMRPKAATEPAQIVWTFTKAPIG